jgi:hypothetical protein
MADIERLYKILDSQISKKSVNQDFDINISLGNSNRLLPLNDVIKIVDQSVVFEEERDLSEKYRFLGSIRQNISNVLINITGIDTYESVINIVNNPTLDYLSPKEVIDETNGWFFYSTDDCTKKELSPYKKDLLLIKDGIKDNWVVKLTYPYSGSSDTIYFNAGNNPLRPVYIKDGIAITKVENILVGGKGMTVFETPIKHGLKIGDQIIISGNTIYDGKHVIYSLGDDNGDNLENNFIIDVFNNVPTITNTFASFKRIVDNVPSKYILRYFKSITDENDIDYYLASFSKTYYSDEVICYNTNVDIDLSLYKDYLGRPITETYLSLIKNKTGNNYGVWDNIKSGIQTSVPKVNYDIRQINESTSTVLDMGVVKSSDTVFLGDIMDYNEGDISERVLVDINHRFNSINRDLNNYYEGYFYSPHKKMIIKYYSNQIEYSDIDLPTINVPDYALTVNGRKMWRDILTKGYIDEIGRGVDYPFLNGFNYISNNFQLSVKRQDPELNYEHGNDPIIIGIPCNITENINTSQDVC